MDPLITAAMVTGGAQLLGGGIGAFGQRAADQRNNEAQLHMQREADLRNMQFWAMQQKYNSPERQVARMRKAGLNPALLYGSPSAVNMPASNISPSKAAPQRHSNVLAQLGQGVGGAARDAMNAMITQKQLQQMDSNIVKNLADASHTNAKTTGQKSMNARIAAATAPILEGLKLDNLSKNIQNQIDTITLSNEEERQRKQLDIMFQNLKQSEYKTIIMKVQKTLAAYGLGNSTDDLAKLLVMAYHRKSIFGKEKANDSMFSTLTQLGVAREGAKILSSLMGGMFAKLFPKGLQKASK